MEEFQKDLAKLNKEIQEKVSEFISKYPVKYINIDTPTIDVRTNAESTDYILGRVETEVLLHNK